MKVALVGRLVPAKAGWHTIQVTPGIKVSRSLFVVEDDGDWLIVHTPTYHTIGCYNTQSAAIRVAHMLIELPGFDRMYNLDDWPDFRPMVEDIVYGNTRKSDFSGSYQRYDLLGRN